LTRLASELGIDGKVIFAGAKSFEETQEHYARAHLVIMPGTKEGWPKVIGEAWAASAIPVAAKAGLVPWILSDATAGALFEPTAESLGGVLADLLREPAELEAKSRHLSLKAKEVSLGEFRDRLIKVVEQTAPYLHLSRGV
jgi:glycosyltransferase involved in cell wall biosynthesis